MDGGLVGMIFCGIMMSSCVSNSPFLLDNRYLLGLATTLCNLILVGIFPFLPESPRWLLAQVPNHPLLPRQGRHAEAAAIITHMRRINKDEELPNLEERLQEAKEQHAAQ